MWGNFDCLDKMPANLRKIKRGGRIPPSIQAGLQVYSLEGL